MCAHEGKVWGEKVKEAGRWGGGNRRAAQQNQKTFRSNFQQRTLKIKANSVIILIKLWHLKNAIKNSYRS